MGPNLSRAAGGGENPLGLKAFCQVPDSAGPALDQLSAALAGMLERGDDPYRATAAEKANTAAAAADPAADAGEMDVLAPPLDDVCEVTPRSILEAMLFVGSPTNEPLSGKQVADLMRGVRPAEIDALVRELNADYESRKCPYTIVSEGAGYRLALRDEYAALGDKFHGKARQARLSRAAIEVLAAVAYHAGITADEVSRLRGTPSGSVLTHLVRRQLVRWERSDSKPRRARYSTTPRFLELFGLQSLDELPRGTDLDKH